MAKKARRRPSTRKKSAGAFPPTYRAKSDGHCVYAREGTADDVASGRVGAVGDFLVMREGHNIAQWFERATFLEQYEPEMLFGDADDLEKHAAAAAAVLK